mmetsp:Transcript_35277/g.55062  ORF Transcript_35277/g.55062 Transcript_35277/m.55062 type:complete len:212 (-) Transcript_35277:74-709(-)
MMSGVIHHFNLFTFEQDIQLDQPHLHAVTTVVQNKEKRKVFLGSTDKSFSLWEQQIQLFQVPPSPPPARPQSPLPCQPLSPPSSPLPQDQEEKVVRWESTSSPSLPPKTTSDALHCASEAPSSSSSSPSFPSLSPEKKRSSPKPFSASSLPKVKRSSVGSIPLSPQRKRFLDDHREGGEWAWEKEGEKKEDKGKSAEKKEEEEAVSADWQL